MHLDVISTSEYTLVAIAIIMASYKPPIHKAIVIPDDITQSARYRAHPNRATSCSGIRPIST